ncbi:hypothetical protein GGR54DRAFT_622630 [Hypoxylon sp. NC1633]|nr:hypothetical protein GGR54DRAFT_622630 [Hypoxylon sp. NC1633]
MDSSDSTAQLAHDQRATVLIGVICLSCSVATIAVGLRLYTRSRMLKQLGADDHLVFIAWAFALATGISQCINTHNGLGKHVWDLGSEGQLKNYLKGFYVSITLYNVGLMFVKLAFLAHYYRALAVRKMRLTFLVAMVIIGCWSLSQIIVGISVCDPISGFWENPADSSCIPNYQQWYINAAGNIATDIAIFVLPLPVLVHLHLPRAQRLVLIGIFSLGFFTCAISVIRIKFLKQEGDVSYENVEASIWSITELCSGVTCACLPTLRPLVSRWIPSLSNRLHKPTRDCKRDSGSCVADAERGRHPRGNSNTSDMLGISDKEELFYCIGIEGRQCNNVDGSDDLVELKADRGSVLGREESSPTPPADAHIAVHIYRKPEAYDGWEKSSVTTEIRTGGNDKWSGSNRYISATAIQVQRDVVMHKVQLDNLGT